MKKILLILLALMISPTQARQLKTFSQIYNSIQSGNAIRMVIDFDHCIPRPPVANISVYTAPTSVMMQADYLQFSNSPLTTNHPKFLKKSILENVTYRITKQNEMNMVVRVIALPDYSVVREVTSVCPLGRAVRVFNK